jgi:hypothetical protein
MRNMHSLIFDWRVVSSFSKANRVVILLARQSAFQIQTNPTACKLVVMGRSDVLELFCISMI